MDVSVIIVNYNTKELTQQCIESVFAKTAGLTFEVILVDNASTDGSKDLFEKDPRIQYIYSEENLGFGRANNLGYAHANGDYLFFLNSDTYLVNNAVFYLWDALREQDKMMPPAACAGGMLKGPDGEIVHSYARFPSKSRALFNASLGVILWKLHVLKTLPWPNNYDYEKWKDKAVFDVDYITGADLMVRRDVADRLGLFDPDFFMYYEESEMQHRYMREGYRRMIVNGPEIVHLEGKSNSTHSPQRTSMVLKSQMLYFKKTTPSLPFHVFKLLFKIAYILTQIICFPFVRGTAGDKIAHIKFVAHV